MVMMAIFDCVDDTVLVRKAIISVSCVHFSVHQPPHCVLVSAQCIGLLIDKAVVGSVPQEMIAGLEELCDNHFGRRVLLYLLSHRNPRHFSSQFISILSPGDGNPHRYMSIYMYTYNVLVISCVVVWNCLPY